MRFQSLIVAVFLFFLHSCTGGKTNDKPLTQEEKLWKKVDSIKQLAEEGDLVTRLNDNIVSLQTRLLNTKDQTYSHAGIVQTIGGIKMVTHIDAGEDGGDTIRFEPIDSFLHPQKNLNAGLFRYQLTNEEMKSFLGEINNYHQQKVVFDHLFVFGTDSAMYCSEMIYKAMKKATNDRVQIELSKIPPIMVNAVWNYSDRVFTKEYVGSHPIVSIENLYLMPYCKEVLRVTLKEFPGQ